MTSLFGDVRYSLRSLAAQPGFVVIAVLSLALGIGVNTAIFSALNALLLRPIAVRDLARSGGAMGMAVAVVGTRWLDSLLFGISTADPVTFIAVPLILAGVALLACVIPARHAARLNVLQALRRD